MSRLLGSPGTPPKAQAVEPTFSPQVYSQHGHVAPDFKRRQLIFDSFSKLQDHNNVISAKDQIRGPRGNIYASRHVFLMFPQFAVNIYIYIYTCSTHC